MLHVTGLAHNGGIGFHLVLRSLLHCCRVPSTSSGAGPSSYLHGLVSSISTTFHKVQLVRGSCSLGHHLLLLSWTPGSQLRLTDHDMIEPAILESRAFQATLELSVMFAHISQMIRRWFGSSNMWWPADTNNFSWVVSDCCVVPSSATWWRSSPGVSTGVTWRVLHSPTEVRLTTLKPLDSDMKPRPGAACWGAPAGASWKSLSTNNRASLSFYFPLCTSGFRVTLNFISVHKQNV